MKSSPRAGEANPSGTFFFFFFYNIHVSNKEILLSLCEMEQDYKFLSLKCDLTFFSHSQGQGQLNNSKETDVSYQMKPFVTISARQPKEVSCQMTPFVAGFEGPVGCAV